MTRWRVRGYVTAPGEFPERVERDVVVEAPTIELATRAGQDRLSTLGIEPIVIFSVVRIRT